MHGNAFQHFIHVDFGKAGDKLYAVIINPLQRHRKADLFVCAVRVGDADLSLCEGGVIKAGAVLIPEWAGGGIKPAVCLHEGKLLHMKKLLDAGLIGLEMLGIAQVISRHQVDSHVDIIDALPEIGSNHLLPSAGQLVEIKKADGTHGGIRVIFRLEGHPYGAEHKNDQHQKPPDNRYGKGVFSFRPHTANASACSLPFGRNNVLIRKVHNRTDGLPSSVPVPCRHPGRCPLPDSPCRKRQCLRSGRETGGRPPDAAGFH